VVQRDQQRSNYRRIAVFLAFSFGIAWAGAIVIRLTGGLADSPRLGGTGLTLATVLLATVTMFAPSVANVLTRATTSEGWRDLQLRPNLAHGWPYWLVSWLAPGLLTVAGMAAFFALFPQYYDASLGAVRQMAMEASEAAGETAAAVNPWAIVATQGLVAVLLAPVLNAIPTFGEEFGWRGYLQPKLLSFLSARKTMVVMGVIWGVWHWPIVAMGYNYGQTYLGAPWLGMVGMVWFTTVLGTLLGWVTIRGRSVWPAVIGHGAINGIAGIALFFVAGQPNLVLGPHPAGLIGSVGFAIVALLILVIPGALEPEPGTRSAADT
jgi:membrane protease YdiL (CAAX protease family)